ncbi:glutaredoxin family protein [Arsenicicoccus dermatophilus]|uniref:glutaredoxin family protein n=1 Tax=Arsenicicoccus dermatophilus TaxID=1076331 RepID=UPI00391759BD
MNPAATPGPSAADSPDPASPLTGARVVLLGRVGCHLCDDAREVIEQVVADTGDTVAEVWIDDHPELLERYAEQIPVTFVDGRQHDYWRVDAGRLRRALV